MNFFRKSILFSFVLLSAMPVGLSAGNSSYARRFIESLSASLVDGGQVNFNLLNDWTGSEAELLFIDALRALGNNVVAFKTSGSEDDRNNVLDSITLLNSLLEQDPNLFSKKLNGKSSRTTIMEVLGTLNKNSGGQNFSKSNGLRQRDVNVNGNQKLTEENQKLKREIQMVQQQLQRVPVENRGGSGGGSSWRSGLTGLFAGVAGGAFATNELKNNSNKKTEEMLRRTIEDLRRQLQENNDRSTGFRKEHVNGARARRQQLQQLRARIQALTGERDGFQNERDVLGRQLQTNDQQHRLAIQAKDGGIRKLRGEIDRLNCAIEDAKRKNVDSESIGEKKQKQLRSELEVAEKEEQEFECLVGQLKERLKMQESNFIKKCKSSDNKYNELLPNRDLEITKLRRELEDEKKKLVSTEKKHNNLIGQHAGVSIDFHEWMEASKKQIIDLMKTLDVSGLISDEEFKELKNVDEQEFNRKSSELIKKIASGKVNLLSKAMEENDELKKKNADFENEIKNQCREIEALKKQSDTKKINVKRDDDTIKRMRGEIGRLNRALEEAKHKNVDSESNGEKKQTQLRSELEVVEKEKKELECLVGQLNERLKTQESDFIKKCNSSDNKYNESLQNKELEIENLKKEQTNRRSEQAGSLQKRIDELQGVVAKQKEEMGNLMSSKQSSDAASKMATTKYNNLLGENNRLKEENEWFFGVSKKLGDLAKSDGLTSQNVVDEQRDLKNRLSAAIDKHGRDSQLVKRLQAEIKRLSKMQESLKQLEELKNRNGEIIKKNSCLEHGKIGLEKEVNELRKQVEELNRKFRNKQLDHGDKVRQLERDKRGLSKGSCETKDKLTGELERKKEEVENLKAEVTNLTREIDELRCNREEGWNWGYEIGQERNRLRQENEQLQDKLNNTEIHNATAGWLDNVMQKNQDRQQVSGFVDGVFKNVENKKRQQDLQQEIDDLARANELWQKNHHRFAKKKNEEVSSLKSQLETLRKQLEKEKKRSEKKNEKASRFLGGNGFEDNGKDNFDEYSGSYKEGLNLF